MRVQIAAALLLWFGVASLPGSANAALVVSKAPTSNVNCAGGVCTATANKAVLNVSDLANMLASDNVKISSGSLAQDIEIDAALNWTSTSRLTLDSYHAISFNKLIEVAGTGALTITTNDGGTGGDYRFFGKGHIELRDLNAGLVINGDRYALAQSLHQLQRLARTKQFIALAGSIEARKRAFASAPIASFGASGGVIEGLGNSISNLTIADSNGHESVGLIGQLDNGDGGTTVRDIGLISVSISSNGTEMVAGALVGENLGGSIENAYATGELTASGGVGYFGGLVGRNDEGKVKLSHAGMNVSANGSAFVVGGLVGANFGDCSGSCIGVIEQSYATGPVNVSDGALAGDLAGLNENAGISDCYATGAVIGGNSAAVGGLVGANQISGGTELVALFTSYSTGTASAGAGSFVGGLAGEDSATSTNIDDYWDLDTSGISDPAKGAGNLAERSRHYRADGRATQVRPTRWLRQFDLGREVEHQQRLSVSPRQSAAAVASHCSGTGAPTEANAAASGDAFLRRSLPRDLRRSRQRDAVRSD